MIRLLDIRSLRELAQYASVPVINGLTKFSHPCQIMADIMTFEESKGSIHGKTIAWLGDNNNVLTSWIQASGRFGFRLNIAVPPGYEPDPELIKKAKKDGGEVFITHDAMLAAKNVDAVTTDTWVSMGQDETMRNQNIFQAFQVNQRIMEQAHSDAIFLHCLPAHRGEEVTNEVIDGPQSRVFDEVENRLHAQKGILQWCFML